MALTKAERQELTNTLKHIHQAELAGNVTVAVSEACRKELLACRRALEEINDYSDAHDDKKAAAKKQVYEIMEDIRKASGGKLKVGWWESFKRKNMPELAAAVYGSGVALGLTLALGLLKVSTLGTVGAVALGLVGVANPIGAAVVGGVLAVAVAAVVVWAVCKCLSAGIKALKNWFTGAKQTEANEVKAAEKRVMEASKTHALKPMSQTQQHSGVVVVVQSGKAANASPTDDLISRWSNAKTK